MKPKLFILEGADRVGKTTIAKYLARYYDAIYWHMTCSSTLAPAMLDYQSNCLDNIIDNMLMGRNVIIDRHWPSEVCYGSVLRKVDTDLIRKRFEGKLRELGARYIFCFNPKAGELHEADKDPDHPYDADIYDEIYRNYYDLYIDMKEVYPPGHIIDYDYTKDADTQEHFKAFLERLGQW